MLARQEIFNRDHAALDYFTGGRQGTVAALKKFIPEGVNHIFTGPTTSSSSSGLVTAGGRDVRLLTS